MRSNPRQIGGKKSAHRHDGAMANPEQGNSQANQCKINHGLQPNSIRLIDEITVTSSFPHVSSLAGPMAAVLSVAQVLLEW